MTREPLARRLGQEYVVFLVVAMLVAIPVLSPFTMGASGRALRYGLFQSVGALLLIVLLARVQFRGGLRRLAYLAGSGVNAPLALFLVWAAVSALRAPDHAFAVGEMLRLGCGALIYFAVALHLENRSQLRLLLDCLVGLVILVVGYGLFFPRGEEVGIAGVLPSRHHLSAILVILLPLLVSLAWAGEDLARRIWATAAAAMSAIGLALCLERSAWIASVAGLAVLYALHATTGSTRGACAVERESVPRRRPTAFAAVMAAGGILLLFTFFAATGVDALVAERARQIPTALQRRDDSFEWRVRKWRGTTRMAMARPVFGWGPGQFVLNQDRFTGLGMSRDLVISYGASFDEMAYNEYLQTAAELGLPGLLLYLLILISFFSKAIRALPRLPPGFRRACLVGSAAGVAAQMVDAAANGSWRYAECSIFFWLVLGIGVAIVRMASQAAVHPRRIGASAEARAEGGSRLTVEEVMPTARG